MTTILAQSNGIHPGLLIVFGFALGVCLAAIAYQIYAKTKAKAFQEKLRAPGI